MLERRLNWDEYVVVYRSACHTASNLSTTAFHPRIKTKEALSARRLASVAPCTI